MASVKESSQTLRLNIITKDIEEEVKIWECDDYAEESPEMASVKVADSSQTLGLNVTFKEEEKDDFGESDHGETPNSSDQVETFPASVKHRRKTCGSLSVVLTNFGGRWKVARSNPRADQVKFCRSAPEQGS
ncbi:uncharacterized protein LOC112262144 isoform X2 [Oncorhynchus tshawytscha]|uniref:uncharacterized protein LOC112262144 isoform X2 n=1 Tax=Oncorhynchus tshawytscha TaxID=74940 RepID=UPI001C3CCC47|nr:uncharacterized protein LOC112262144 isoform X2 [Oncorhynchus tshawytscha]